VGIIEVDFWVGDCSTVGIIEVDAQEGDEGTEVGCFVGDRT